MAYIGHLFIISAASGVGKTSLVRTITKKITNIVPSVSYTTRNKRPSERQGIDYFFTSKQQFNIMESNQEFLESSLVFEHCYGTSKDFVLNLLASGKDVILEIDWQGAQKIKNNLHKLFQHADDMIGCSTIFILPPSLKSLKDRLRSRGQDDLCSIQKRLDSSKQEIEHYVDYDYIVINDNFNQAVQDLISIINAQRMKKIRQELVHAILIKNLLA